MQSRQSRISTAMHTSWRRCWTNTWATMTTTQGLINGRLAVVWPASILSEGDKRKSGLEEWAWQQHQTLAQLPTQCIRRPNATMTGWALCCTT